MRAKRLLSLTLALFVAWGAMPDTPLSPYAQAITYVPSVFLFKDNDGASQTNTEYLFPNGTNQDESTTEANRQNIMPIDGFIVEAYFEDDTDPTAAGSQAITIMLDADGDGIGIATSINGTFSNGVQNFTWTGAVAFSALNRLSMEIDPTGTPVIGHISGYIIIAAAKCIYVGVITSPGAANTTYMALSGDHIGGNWSGSENFGAGYFPTGGTMSDFVGYINIATGVGNTRRFVVRQNLANSALDVTLSNPTLTWSDTSSVTVTGGDRLAVRHTLTGTPTDMTITSWAVSFVPDTPGQYNFPRSGLDVPSTTATRYTYLFDVNKTWSADQTIRNNLLPACTFIGMYAKFSTDPDNGAGTQSWALTMYEGNTPTLKSSTCTVSDGTTTCNDMVNTFVVTKAQEIGWQSVPANTPTASTSWVSGVAIYIDPASLTINQTGSASKFFQIL